MSEFAYQEPFPLGPVEVLEYPELGMEAVYRIEVGGFPAYILVDDKGNEFFSPLPVLS